MAGKFLTPEETAHALGIPVEEVIRLVDRKELYPVRDGAAVKYKVDDIERIKASRLADANGGGSGLSLDLDLEPDGKQGGAASGGPAPGGAVSVGAGSGLELDGGPPGESIFSVEGSGVAVPAAAEPAARSALDDLELDDLVISDDVLAAPPGVVSGKGAAASGLGPPSGSLAAGSAISGLGSQASGGSVVSSIVVGGGDVLAGSGVLSGSGSMAAGSALSGVLDSGLSLEDDDAAESGIDVAGLDDVAGDSDGAEPLGNADDFELTAADEDESGSVVIAAESESAESSFFGTGGGEESSSAFSSVADGSAAAVAEAGDLGDAAVVRDTTFSVWQICGLVCCALLLLTGGFVMFDLVRTLGSAEDLSLSNPLLSPMADIFGWR